MTRIPDRAELGPNDFAALRWHNAFYHRQYAHIRAARGDDPVAVRKTRQIACDECWWAQIARGRERERRLAERGRKQGENPCGNQGGTLC
jgi:hypothetical protein